MHITWYVSKENCEKIYKQIIVELGIHKTDIFTNLCYYISYIIFLCILIYLLNDMELSQIEWWFLICMSYLKQHTGTVSI